MMSAVTENSKGKPLKKGEDAVIIKAAEMDESDTNDNRLNENDHEKQEEEDEDEGDFSDEDEDEFDEDSEGSEGLESENGGEWNENVVEPELEFDEMGLELAAQDARYRNDVRYRKALNIFTQGRVEVEEPFVLYRVPLERKRRRVAESEVKIEPSILHQMGVRLGKFWGKVWPAEGIVNDPGNDPNINEIRKAEMEAEEGTGESLPNSTHPAYVSFLKGQELAKEERDSGATFRTGAITPDGLIDEDFEEELGSPSQDDCKNDPETEFRDIAKYGIVQVAGDDTYGRKVIVFSSCRLPPSTELDHQRLLAYLKHTLDQYVENDYTLVYFHHGLNSSNKPTFRWLRQAYREFDRKYKKNLKALYLVHPTNFIKIMWGIFKPLISAKFGRKVMYVNYLHELAQYLQLDQLIIPQRVKNHDDELVETYKSKDCEAYDAFLLAKNKPQPVPTSIIHAPYPTQQFGVSLQFIKEHNHDIIPPVVQQTVSYLREKGLETEGIFRRSANASVLKQVQQQFNEGTEVNFEELGDVHIPAAILKSFLRQLQEPLLTFDLYDHTIRVQCLEEKEKIEEMKRILHDELPDDNYCVLKYVISFLVEVTSHQQVNLMTSQNLAIVFGPNLMWSKSNASLASMGYVNSCCLLLIIHYDELFSK